MNILVFDTETTSISEKCFTYNIGYTIADTETQTILIKKEFVIEQIWHNIELFATAYFADKRPIYVSAMRARKAKLTKFGYACQEMIRDINNFNVECAYAFNAPFDIRVFNFNCDWFKCSNPLELIPVYDIAGNVHHCIAFTSEYQNFCDEHELYTDNGNYSTTAENVYRFLTNNVEFIESHTALSDSIIETEILMETVKRGCEIGIEYKKYSTIPRKVNKTLTIVVNKAEEHIYNYYKKIVRGDKIFLTTD